MLALERRREEAAGRTYVGPLRGLEALPLGAEGETPRLKLLKEELRSNDLQPVLLEEGLLSNELQAVLLEEAGC